MTSIPEQPAPREDLAPGARLLGVRACAACGSVATVITSAGEVNHEREHGAYHKRLEARLRDLEARVAEIDGRAG